MASPILWQWQVIAPDGQYHRGVLLAASHKQASARLAEQGHHILALRRHPRPGRQYRHIRHRITFLRQLATLLQAGVSLDEGLSLLGNQHPLPAWQALLAGLRAGINQGQTFSVALAATGLFPPLVLALITTGELTGQLERCCQQLAQQQAQQHSLQQQVVKALRYPLFVLAVALLVSAAMVGLVLPQFAAIYQTFNAPLPALTRGVLGLADIASQWGLTALLLCGLLATGVPFARRRYPVLLRVEQHLLLRLPLVSALIIDQRMTMIFTTLALTQHVGVSLLDGLTAAGSALPAPLWRECITRLQAQISAGETLSRAMEESPLFPALAVQMVATGEASGALDTMLAHLAEEFSQQAYARATALSATLEPVMMIVMGGIIGTLVVAMYLPLFQLGEILH
ncbi:protein transport protein HofC [Shimwellia pseudoproteus]|uniref:protein transport protein HofC n=1 Tax=Shimwellia pseudoproteus TaxID=570012 RepID=UPI0018EE11D3|nr:protein transport protein HofC [Shimwellia pseudoproteus]MBJ3813432.1 protein transport protein HofC [Shimwellia pseudoproteus]